VVAGWQALTALKPGKAVAGLPNVESVRQRAAQVINGQDRSDHVLQHLADMLRTGDLTLPSPVDASRDDANDRVEHLAWAYRSLSAAFVLTALLTVIPILTN